MVNSGGRIQGESFLIRTQQPVSLYPLEQSFPNIHYSYQTTVVQAADWKFKGRWTDFVIGRGDNDIFKHSINQGDELTLTFTGKAFLLEGYCHNNGGMANPFHFALKLAWKSCVRVARTILLGIT